jgi:hypothetical protein
VQTAPIPTSACDEASLSETAAQRQSTASALLEKGIGGI